MPEIKIKHVVSFSSEDKVHKAENLLKPETYRKWKCASPGEKNATIVLQFEKATQIHSINIGNEGSAFVEVFVGRSSDLVSDYQILLVASSFMSPLESRNGTHTNRVCMFGPHMLSHQTKDEKWDCVQVVCTQPFNKNVAYGLTFIKFHSPSEKVEEQPSNAKEEKYVPKLGAFNLKEEEDENESLPSVGSCFGKEKANDSESLSDVKTDAQNAETSDNDEEFLKMYFDEAEWNEFSDYEKKRFVKIKRNYDQLLAMGIDPITPTFMLPKKKEKNTVGLKTNSKKSVHTTVPTFMPQKEMEENRVGLKTSDRKNPELWTKEHISHWLTNIEDCFGIGHIDRSHMPEDGISLCRLSTDDFHKITGDRRLAEILSNYMDCLKQNFKFPSESSQESCVKNENNKATFFEAIKQVIDKSSRNKSSSSSGGGQIQLWQFLLELLDDPEHSSLIAWEDEEGTFRLLNPERIAKLWGKRKFIETKLKRKKPMNYDKLSRSLRHYYSKGIVNKVNGRRHTYKFHLDGVLRACSPSGVGDS